MEGEATVADDDQGAKIAAMLGRLSVPAALRVGPYVISGRVAVFPGVEVLTGTHEITGARVVLRRLLPMPAVSREEATRRLEAFRHDARLRQYLSDPRSLLLFDFAHHQDGSGYQVFSLPEGCRSVPREGQALPVEEWLRIAAESGAAMQSLIEAGILEPQFHPSGLLLSSDGGIHLVPMDFPWPSGAATQGTTNERLATWLYELFAAAPLPPGRPPASLCDSNPRVNAELDRTIRAAMNPHATLAVSSPGEFARLLRSCASRREQIVPIGPVHATEQPSFSWANVGAGAVLLALGGITLGWLLSLYFSGR